MCDISHSILRLSSDTSGLQILSLDEEKAFKFWDEWYTYLSGAGIDFVKL